jgi:vacuolar-type H+-ATPase subunit E/Vma4
LSLQELQSEIERKAEEEASRVLDAANREAQEIVAKAEARAASLRDERTAGLSRELNTQEKSQLAVTRMERKGELLQVKAKWAKRVSEEAEKRIADIAQKGGTEYRELLMKLILQGVAKLTGTNFVIEANSRDNKLIMPTLSATAQKAAQIKNGPVVLRAQTLETRTMGGVVVSTEDGTQYFNNTLEARLSTVTRNLEGTVHKILFGEPNE